MGKTNAARKYINCPRCSVPLLQVEIAQNGLIRCERCKQFISFDVENGKITVEIVPSKQDVPS